MTDLCYRGIERKNMEAGRVRRQAGIEFAIDTCNTASLMMGHIDMYVLMAASKRVEMELGVMS